MNDTSIGQMIDYIKEFSKRVVCTCLVMGNCAFPIASAIAEKHDEKIFNNETRQEQMINSDLVFIVEGAWEKDYTKGYDNNQISYFRIVRRIKIKDSFDVSIFNNNYEEVLNFVKNSANMNDIFEIVDEKKESISVNANEVMSVDMSNIHMRVEGTDIVVSTSKINTWTTLLYLLTVGMIIAGGIFVDDKKDKKKAKRLEFEERLREGFNRDRWV